MIKATKQHIGVNCHIPESASIECEELFLGDGVLIGERAQIKGKQIYIGDFSLLGADSNVATPFFKMGEYTKIHNHALINGKTGVEVGHNCWIGQNCVLNGEALLTIGNNVGIGTYSSIWTHGYFGQLIDGCNYFSIKSTVIEDDVWLVGSYNTVFPGVTIGTKSVLMGTSVVTKNIPMMHTFSGNPASDITSKVKEPYTPISTTQKIELLKQTLEGYFSENNYAYTAQETSLSLEGYGVIYFLKDNFVSAQPVVCFSEEVKNWDIAHKELSLFCLASKKYSKNKTPLEILVRKILNTSVARFIPV